MADIERPRPWQSVAAWQTYADQLEARIERNCGFHQESETAMAEQLRGAVERIMRAFEKHDLDAVAFAWSDPHIWDDGKLRELLTDAIGGQS